ncbi:hypothetical protein QAD02_018581 [Eretmocerus hayati]|uniref:Uncharacterized protein n=1 Tax=Eretmocerus hayati TaxID=131215 RepID=A0ACC2PJL7_9HYME|nr:hypothetical protein QAD02_018581 [Eretmocerus hayati]
MADVAKATRTKVPKDGTKTKVKKQPSNSNTRPTTSEMILEAVEKLADRKGSSLSAIKKYINANHQVDVEKQANLIKKYLKNAVVEKTLVQVKGIGAGGSFRLPRKNEVQGKPKKPTTKELPKKAKATAKKVKSPAKVRKSVAPKRASKPKPAKTVKAPKSPQLKKSTASKTKSVALKSSKPKSNKK